MVKSHHLAELLEKDFEVLKNVTNIFDLMLLEKSTLKSLVVFEKCLIEKLEFDNLFIEYQTSGHYRDRLEIYQAAMSRNINLLGRVYFDDEGGLNYSIVEHVSQYLPHKTH